MGLRWRCPKDCLHTSRDLIEQRWWSQGTLPGPVGRLELRRCQVIQGRVNALGLIDIFDEMTDLMIGIPIVNVVCQIDLLFFDGAYSGDVVHPRDRSGASIDIIQSGGRHGQGRTELAL